MCDGDIKNIPRITRDGKLPLTDDLFNYASDMSSRPIVCKEAGKSVIKFGKTKQCSNNSSENVIG